MLISDGIFFLVKLTKWATFIIFFHEDKELQKSVHMWKNPGYKTNGGKAIA